MAQDTDHRGGIDRMPPRMEDGKAAYLAQKYGVTAAEILKVFEQVGPDLAAVERELQKLRMP